MYFMSKKKNNPHYFKICGAKRKYHLFKKNKK